MTTSRKTGFESRAVRRAGKGGLRIVLGALLIAGGVATVAVPALAQSWWPWGGGEERPRQPRQHPEPREPVYGDPYDEPVPQQQAPPSYGNQAAGRSPICLELERRLVQEGQRSSADQVPQIENELREVRRSHRTQRQQLDRNDCYEYFLFSKTLRRTRQCVDLANQAEEGRRRIQELESRLHQAQGSAGRSYQDEIVRELARNNCGSNYQQQARRQDGGGLFGFWEDQESSGGVQHPGGFGTLPYATYRTVCVRLCDGYYFPVSFSTLPNHFQRDEDACQSKCAAPAKLYYHQNPGAGMEQAVAASTNEPYTQLKTAFRYRKEYMAGCSCKISEYQPEPGTLPALGAAAGTAGGWNSGDMPAGSSADPAFGGGQEELPWATNP